MQLSIGILLLAASLAYAQTPAARPRFEVSSIKASDPSAPRPGRLGAVPVVTSPGRLTVRNAYLTELIKAAYTLNDYQVSGGPAWLTWARHDIGSFKLFCLLLKRQVLSAQAANVKNAM